MAPLVSIAWRLVTSQSPANAWRRIALPVTILCSILVCSVTVSIINAYWEQDHRGWARAASVFLFEPPVDRTRQGLHVLTNADYWHGRQYLQMWIEPPLFGEAVLPPGLSRIPSPGEAAVSPALAREIERHPELATRYPAWFLITGDGITSPDELIAWVRPTEPEPFFAEGPGFVLEFNRDSAAPSVNRHLIGEPINKLQILMMTTITVVMPVVFLLMAGMTTASTVRDHRVDLLTRLGAERFWIARLNLLESLLLAVPILLVTLPLWRPTSARLTTIPILDLPVLRGDMTLRWDQMVLIAGATVVLIVIAAFAQVLLRRGRRGARPRSLLSRGVAPILPASLVVGAILLAFIGVSNESESGIIAYLMIVLVVLGLLPSLVGSLAQPLGVLLGRVASLPVRLAGDRLRYRSASALRPFVGLATVIVLMQLTFGVIAFLTARLPFVDHTASPSSAEVISPLPPATIGLAVKQAMPDAMIFPFHETTDGRYVAGTSCEQVATFLRAGNVCGSMAEPTSELFGDTFYYSDPFTNITFDPTLAEDARDTTHLLVVSHASMEQIDIDVRAALPIADHPGLRVRTPESFAITAPPTVPWLQRGASAFIALTALTLIGAMVDQSISGTRGSRMLVALCASRGHLAAVEGVAFAASSLLAISIGIVVAMLQLWSFQRLYWFAWSDVPILPVLGVILAASLVSAMLVMTINANIAFTRERRAT